MKILETIGNTPLVEIEKINPNQKVKIYAKIEGANPTGSIKDRIALAMIEYAEKTGVLKKEKRLLKRPAATPASALPWWRRSRDTKRSLFCPNQ
jgi:Cysteine synthase